jgi:hypothetical protein
MNVSTANADAEIANAEASPPTKVGLRNRVRSNIGRGCRSSTSTNTASNPAAVMIEPKTRPEPHECVFDSISPYTRAASAPLNDTAPSQSGRPASGSRDSSTRNNVSAIAITPIGTLTKKIHRHVSPLVIAPPSTGPTATAMPVIAPNTPNATPRSSPRKASASNASDVANMAAPPTPWPARASDRNTGLCATPHSSEPVVKTAIPAAKTILRPNRSATEPAVSRSAARLSA